MLHLFQRHTLQPENVNIAIWNKLIESVNIRCIEPVSVIHVFEATLHLCVCHAEDWIKKRT